MSYRANISFLNSISRNQKASFQTIYMVGIPCLMSRGSLNCPKILCIHCTSCLKPSPSHSPHNAGLITELANDFLFFFEYTNYHRD